MDFSRYVEDLMFHHKLVVGDQEFRLVEIEFYVMNDDHQDLYTHCSKYQLKNREFYFHRFKNNTPKEGTFKGMDICFGDASTNNYFGVLIRAIEDLTNGQVIEGPCKTVNKILEIHQLTKAKELVAKIKQESNFQIDQCQYLKLIKVNDRLSDRSIRKGPRIGLSSKYPQWQLSPYRFVTSDKIKKQKTSLKN